MTLELLIVGFGSMGQRRARIISELHPDWGPPVTVDPHMGDYDDIDDIEKLEQFDAVFICTPPASHLSAIRRVVDARVALFVEKPLCLPYQLQAARDLLDTHKKPLMVGHNFHWHTGYQKFKAEAGSIGDLVMYEARFGNKLSQWARDNQDAYSLHRDQGGGVLLDCLQDIDLALDVTGGLIPKAYHQVDGRKHEITADTECAAVVLAYGDDGPVASLVFDYMRPDRVRTHTAIGTKGYAVWEETRGDSLDQSYVTETDAFLGWAGSSRRKPRSAPDPFRALEFVGRIQQL